jgi:transposase
MLTDERWAVLAPLVEGFRPHAKVPPRHLRRTIGAIIWRHQNGAKWRALPAEHGPWGTAAQTFILWSRLGVWERLLAMAQASGVVLGVAFLDGTTIRAHQKAAGARSKTADAASPLRGKAEAPGRSRGDFGTKACVIADGAGRAVAFALAPGQPHGVPHAVPLLARLPDVPLGWWPIAASPAMPSAGMCRTSELDLMCRPGATRRRSLAANGPMPADPWWKTCGRG